MVWLGLAWLCGYPCDWPLIYPHKQWPNFAAPSPRTTQGGDRGEAIPHRTPEHAHPVLGPTLSQPTLSQGAPSLDQTSTRLPVEQFQTYIFNPTPVAVPGQNNASSQRGRGVLRGKAMPPLKEARVCSGANKASFQRGKGVIWGKTRPPLKEARARVCSGAEQGLLSKRLPTFPSPH